MRSETKIMAPEVLVEEYRELLQDARIEALPLTVTGNSMSPFLVGGRDTVHWQNWKPKGLFNLPLAEDQEQYDLMDEGGIFDIHKTAWWCRDCGKLVMNFAPERTAAEVEEIYRKPTGYEEQINAWGANPKAYEDYQTQWKEEETT